MNAYPELDGEVVAASRRILTELLRDTLGFEGLVVADYEAIQMIHTYQRVAENNRSAAVLALTAGIDIELPTRVCYGDPLRAALEANEINLEFVDTSVERILRKKMELGLFENPYVDEGRVLEFFETPDQRTLAREIARKSMVLLKNNGVLPLAEKTRTLAVIGPNADSKSNLLGDYSYAAVFDLKSGYMPGRGANFEQIDRAHIERYSIEITTVLSALKTALPATNILYAKGCDNLENDTAGFDEAVNLARQAEAVVLVLGDRPGLTPHCTCGETRDSADLKLPGVQDSLAEAIFAAGKPVIIVLVTGRPYAINRLAEKADAILEAWLPGEEGAAAVAETILGNNNPGGKLAITFPRHVGQVPIFYNQKPSGGKSNWYTNYVSVAASPLFPFGYGLSFTTFEYNHFSVSRTEARAGETIDIMVNITNSGDRMGDEVVQLYIQDEYGSLPRPIQELKGYARVSLQPGETKKVVFHLPTNMLAFYDTHLNYVLESGTFKVMIGSSSEDIRCEGGFLIVGDKKSVVKEPVYTCPVQVCA
jgi:beta-glucosidase